LSTQRFFVVPNPSYPTVRFIAQNLGDEGEGFDRYYERGGILATEDSGISVLAGSAFGGGSAVNWACCLETPWYVRKEWASEHHLKV
jgi:long-chain-alcohol oxidase